jgi:hypothetical protein
MTEGDLAVEAFLAFQIASCACGIEIIDAIVLIGRIVASLEHDIVRERLGESDGRRVNGHCRDEQCE